MTILGIGGLPELDRENIKIIDENTKFMNGYGVFSDKPLVTKSISNINGVDIPIMKIVEENYFDEIQHFEKLFTVTPKVFSFFYSADKAFKANVNARRKECIQTNNIIGKYGVQKKILPYLRLEYLQAHTSSLIINYNFESYKKDKDIDNLIRPLKFTLDTMRQFNFNEIIFNLGYEPSYAHKKIPDHEYIMVFNTMAEIIHLRGYKVAYGCTSNGNVSSIQKKLPDNKILDYISINHFAQGDESQKDAEKYLLDCSSNFSIPVITPELGISHNPIHTYTFNNLDNFIKRVSPKYATFLTLDYSEILPTWTNHKVSTWSAEEQQMFFNVFQKYV